MSSAGRIPLMVVVSLLALAFCAGGASDVLVGLVWVTFLCSLPLIGLIGWLDSVEKRSGPNARYAIASIGLIPLLLIIYAGGRGNGEYMGVIVLAGMGWSAAWYATS